MPQNPTARGQPRKRGPKLKTQVTLPQRRTLQEIERYIRRHQFAPTMKELAALLQISITAAYEQVNQLVRKGYLQRTPGKNRGLALARRSDDQPVRLTPIPLVGTVAAGRPVLADEQIIGEVLVEQPLGEHCFALAVQGESMKGAGISDGDVVIVRMQPLAESGDVVVALVDGEATVKRLYLRENTIELRPENASKKYKPIPIGPQVDLRIIGKVVAIRASGGVSIRD